MSRQYDRDRPHDDGRPTAWQMRSEIVRLRGQGRSLREIGEHIGRHASQVALVLNRLRRQEMARTSAALNALRDPDATVKVWDAFHDTDTDDVHVALEEGGAVVLIDNHAWAGEVR